MNEMVVSALLAVPLPIFVSAGVLEYRRDRQSLRSFRRMLPLALAAVLSILLLIPPDLYFQYVWATRVFVPTCILSLSLAGSALVCRYKSSLAMALIFIGGLLLALLWFVNRIVA